MQRAFKFFEEQDRQMKFNLSRVLKGIAFLREQGLFTDVDEAKRVLKREGCTDRDILVLFQQVRQTPHIVGGA